MKHYAENLGSNVAAMIKVRQVDYPLLCLTQAGGDTMKKYMYGSGKVTHDTGGVSYGFQCFQ